MQATGMDMVNLHATDGGDIYDPEIWSQRCEKCRQKWGNDRTAASAHLNSIYAEEIWKECPGAQVTLTYYYQILFQLGYSRCGAAKEAG